MSLVDPQSRWWNGDATRWRAAYVCWALAIVLTLVGMWSVMAGEVSPLPVWFVLVSSLLPVPLLIGGTFLIVFGTADRDDLDARIIVVPMAAYFVANGSGALVGGSMSPRGVHAGHGAFVVFIIGGVTAIIVAEMLRRRALRNESLQGHVEREGIVTTGVVTRARRYSLNYHPVTRVTVKFTDTQDRDRWVSDTIDGPVTTGEALRVQYLPGHLGRKAAVALSRPESRR